MLGKIISVKNKTAEIEIVSSDAHNKQKCSVGCGVCRLFAADKKKQDAIIAENTVNAEIGQTVEFELKENTRLKASILLFLIPLLSFLLSAIILNQFKVSALVMFAVGILAVFVSLAILKQTLKNKTFYHITKIKEQ